MLRVTADTNILVSGLISPNGKPREFLQMAPDNEINLTLSNAILEETAAVLSRKFGWPQEEISEAQQWLCEIARIATPAVSFDVVEEDPPDNRILECAVSARSAFIVTGDKDLLRLKDYDSIKILTVCEFLEIQAARQQGGSVAR